MELFALTPEDSDFYTYWGYVVGVAGLVLGVIGFLVTLYQLHQTKRAARAAEDASKKAVRESKEAFERFVAAHAGRLLSELQAAVSLKDWKLGAVRCRDLADLVSGLPDRTSDTADMITEDVKQLRGFGDTFDGYAANNAARIAPKVAKDQWKPLLQRLHTRFDQLRAPYRELTNAQNGPDNVPGSSAPPDSRADNEDQRGTS